MARKYVLSGSVYEEQIGYSRAVIDGDYVFVSGTTGFNYSTMSISNCVIDQATQCFENIAQALHEANCTLDDVVRVHYIFPNKTDFEPCWPTFKQYLGKARPAATMFVAELLDDRMKVEIEVTARISKPDTLK